MPQETYTFVQYLLQVPASYLTRDVINNILGFLESDFNLYDWQMMWLLFFLAKYEKLTEEHLQRIFNNKKLQYHPVNKALWIYILCTVGGSIYQRKFISFYSQEQSKEAKMAILCGVYSLDKVERNHFYSLAGGGDRQIDQLIKMLSVRRVKFC